MEPNKIIRKKIKIATSLLSVEILFSVFSLSVTSLTPIVSILIASVLIYLIHRMNKNSYNHARILLLIVFLASVGTNGFTLDNQHPSLSAVFYLLQIAIWAAIFFLINSIYKQLFSEKINFQPNISSPLIGSTQPVNSNKNINPKILLWIFVTPIAVALIIGFFSWIFNSN